MGLFDFVFAGIAWFVCLFANHVRPDHAVAVTVLLLVSFDNRVAVVVLAWIHSLSCSDIHAKTRTATRFWRSQILGISNRFWI